MKNPLADSSGLEQSGRLSTTATTPSVAGTLPKSTTTSANSRYTNVSFRGKLGQITLHKKGLTYREGVLQDDGNSSSTLIAVDGSDLGTSNSILNNTNHSSVSLSQSIKIFWKSLKTHKLHRTNLLLKLVNHDDKALIFKFSNLDDLELVSKDMTTRRKQYASLPDNGLDNSTKSLDDSSMGGSERLRLSAVKPKSSLTEHKGKDNNTATNTSATATKTSRKSKRMIEADESEHDDASSILSRYAVSVHYLQTVLLEEIRAAGMDPATTPIHKIENLSDPKPGLIRRKGAAVKCPIDGRLGAAYVHSIGSDTATGSSLKDFVGVANYMLSYSWSYAIGDIVDTLVDFCHSQSLDPKRSYVWMCCLCVNQHRVVENHKSGMDADSSDPMKIDFFSLFSDRVTSIGHVLALMSPWDNPSYLKRVWCIFELYTAHEIGCDISIVMPPQQKLALEKGLLQVDDNDNNTGMDDSSSHERMGESNIDLLYKVLAQTRVQDAQASVEEDRIAILSHIEKTTKYTALNHRVNELLRGWVSRVLTEIMETKRATGSEDLHYASFCLKIGDILERNGEYDAAMDIYVQALRIRQRLLGDHHPGTAACMLHKGDILFYKGSRQEARRIYQQALTVYQAAKKGDYDKGLALAWHNVGMTFLAEDNADEASIGLLNGLSIRERSLGTDHIHTRDSYSACGTLYRLKGNYTLALEYMSKAQQIAEAKFGASHPLVAESHNNLGVLYGTVGEHSLALVQYTRCLVVHESIFGKDHPNTATSYFNCGTALMQMDLVDRALDQFRKALAIRRDQFGEFHWRVADIHTWMGEIYFSKKFDYKAAVVEYSKALEITMKIAGSEQKDTASCRQRLGKALFHDGDLEGALNEYRECLRLYANQEYPQEADIYSSIGDVMARQGDYDEAVAMVRKAYDLYVSAFGRDSDPSKELSKRIDDLVAKKWSERARQDEST